MPGSGGVEDVVRLRPLLRLSRASVVIIENILKYQFGIRTVYVENVKCYISHLSDPRHLEFA